VPLHDLDQVLAELVLSVAALRLGADFVALNHAQFRETAFAVPALSPMQEATLLEAVYFGIMR
jgi:hypothetical protein